MKKFRSYITEARMTTPAEIIAAVAQHKKAGEILNPVYQDLVYQAKRVMSGNSIASKPDKLLDLVRAEHGSDERDPDLSELYYTSFDTFSSHSKIEKLVNKLEKKNNPKYKAMLADVREYLKVWKPVGEDLKDLKGKIVKTTQKRAEAKQAAEKALGKKFADSSSLIKIFESHLEEYKAMAKKRAEEFVKDRLEFLKKHDWDLDKAVPKTRSYHDYKMVEQKRQVYSSITKAKNPNRGYKDPDIREPDQAKIDHYVKLNVRGAEEAYRSFMQKMIEKIGKPVEKATMTGNIWTNATLTVTTNDGEEQVWNTKMILNFSKYQKMFNQFPSRRKK